MTTPTPMAAVLRCRANLSLIAETTTSSNENSEVKPAMKSEAKNRNPNNPPRGIWLMMAGKATNARPMPEVATSSTATLDCTAMKPRAAKTPMPASTSKEELAKPVTRPVPVRLVRGFR